MFENKGQQTVSKIYDPNEFKDYNYISLSIGALHQYSDVQGFSKASYDFSQTTHFIVNYNHYFGGWVQPTYKSVGGFPSIDMISVGVRYAF